MLIIYGVAIALYPPSLCLMLWKSYRNISFTLGHYLMLISSIIFFLSSSLNSPMHSLYICMLTLLSMTLSNLGLKYQYKKQLDIGLLIGLCLSVLIGLCRHINLDYSPLKFFETFFGETTFGRAEVLMGHPNFLGLHTLMLFFYFLLSSTTHTSSHRMARLLGIFLSIILVALTGSRSAFLGILAGTLTLTFIHRKSLMLLPLKQIVSLFFIVTVLSTLSFLIFWKTNRLPFTLFPEKTYNLFVSTEELHEQSWSKGGIRIDRIHSSQEEPSFWRLSKMEAIWWKRLAQPVTFIPNKKYTLSFQAYPEDTALVWGINGSGIDTNGIRQHVNAKYHKEVSDWITDTSEDFSIMSIKVDYLDTWIYVKITFIYHGESSLTLQIGFTPDQRNTISEKGLVVKQLQIEQNALASDYQATIAPNYQQISAQNTWKARKEIFQIAWNGFIEEPILGWQHKNVSFQHYYSINTSSNLVVSHAHNIFLQTLFSQGVTGILGFFSFVWGLCLLPKGKSNLFMVCLTSVLLANFLDATFWNASTIYLMVTYASLSIDSIEGEW